MGTRSAEANERSRDSVPLAVKIVISGGFGVGKTTFVSTISEIEPLSTEASMTEASIGVDDMSGLSGKNTTTVALDFGRLSLDRSLLMYLFGTPGQDRFAFLWDDLVEGALGVVIMLDTRCIEDCFPALDYFEERGTPLLVAINHFDPACRFDTAEVREALGVAADTPIVDCDARDRDSVKQVLVALVEQVLTRRLATAAG
jgi:signal recognition particle receptor subunit beta